MRVPRRRLTVLVLLYYVGWFEYADRLLVLSGALPLMLEARHLTNDLLLLLHAEDHVTRLDRDGGLRLVRLQGCQVGIVRVDLVRGYADDALLLHAVYVFETLINVATADHLIELEALARNLLLYQSVRLRCRCCQAVTHV